MPIEIDSNFGLKRGKIKKVHYVNGGRIETKIKRNYFREGYVWHFCKSSYFITISKHDIHTEILKFYVKKNAYFNDF